MTDKSLKNKAIKIQNKSYVLVSDRVMYFNDVYPNGMIETTLLSNENGKVSMIAKITPDCSKPERYFTGHSQADTTQGMVNKTAAMENCETSAVGRALALMGIGVIDSIASADEMHKAGLPPEHKDNEFNKSTCPHCGGGIAIGQSGKPYCTNKCWLPENAHFRLSFKGQTSLPTVTNE